MRIPFQKAALAAVVLMSSLLGAAHAVPEPVVQAHQGEVTRLAMVPGRDYIISTGADGNCSLWQYPDLQKARDVMHADSGLLSMTVSHDGKRVATGDALGGVWLAWLWGEEAKKAPLHQKVANDAALDMVSGAEDKRIFSLMLNPAQIDAAVRSWDGTTLDPTRWFQPTGETSLWAMSADANVELIAAVSDTGNVVRWKLPQTMPARYAKQQAKFTCTATSPDGKNVFFGDEKGGIWVISEDRKQPFLLWGFSSPVASITLDSTGQWMAIGFGGPSRKAIYRRTSLKEPYKAPTGASLPIVVLKTSTCLQGPGSGAPTEKQSFTVAGPAGGALCAAFSRNGKHLIAGGSDGTIRLWLITDGKSRLQ